MEEIFEKLQDDTRSLWVSSSVRRLKHMPSPTVFFKDFVATSTPVIIEGGASGWKAAQSWDLESLTRSNPDLEVHTTNVQNLSHIYLCNKVHDVGDGGWRL